MHLLRNRHWLLILSLLASLSLAGCATRPALKLTDMQQAAVGTPSPDKSFWRDTVTYAFPVKYASAKDPRGIVWEVAYLDEYIGKDKAKALVLIHGKGADSGYWSALMKDALEAGLRVVAVDLPNYGKSIPGNLDNPKARTMEDTRVVVHDILVNQLGITKANYLGHSLGGHWVLGYALSFPEAVEKLIVVDAGSFESYPRTLKLPGGEMNWLDPAYAHNYAKWEQIWEPVTHRLAAERAKTEEDIRLFNYFKKKDPKTGEIVDSKLGFYHKDTPDARFETEVRVGMISGPQAEFEAWNVAYARDVYAMGIELLKGDPNSLPARIGTIKAPMFIIFGEEDPFLPATVVTGNTDLRLDYIKPTAEKIKQNGGPAPVVKLYAGAGHFPHTDVPEQFNRDVIDFVYGDPVEGSENPSNYKLPALKLPADIAAFVAEDLAAVKSAKVDRIMAQYHKDFKSDGRDYAATRSLFVQYADQLAPKWVVKITELKIDGDKAVIDGSLSNPFATASLKGTQLIKENGRWLWYGNRK